MMSLLYRMKRKFGRYAITNLPLYVTIAFTAGYLLQLFPVGQAAYYAFLSFMPRFFLKGQIWRIVTAIVYPPVTGGNILLGLLSIYIYYSFAKVVERSIGAFEFNVYFFGSILVGELGSLLYYAITKDPTAVFRPIFTHFSVFMAFAIMYAEQSVLLFFVIPVKVKWVAIIEAAVYVFEFISGGLETKIMIIAAFIPVILFWLAMNKRETGGDIISNIRFKIRQKKRQKEWRDSWK